jgi:hypothetical protein
MTTLTPELKADMAKQTEFSDKNGKFVARLNDIIGDAGIKVVGDPKDEFAYSLQSVSAMASKYIKDVPLNLTDEFIQEVSELAVEEFGTKLSFNNLKVTFWLND